MERNHRADFSSMRQKKLKWRRKFNQYRPLFLFTIELTMSLTTRTWAHHFLELTEGKTPKNTMPIWNAFMAQLADALNKPKVDSELREQGTTTVHFNITSEQAKLLQEEGSVDRIAKGLGVDETTSDKIGIQVRLFGLEGDPRGVCVQVNIIHVGNEPRGPDGSGSGSGINGPDRRLEPDVDIPDCDTRLCENVQSVCYHATLRKDCPVVDWFLGMAYVHKYTACEADFRKGLEEDPEFVAFLARQLEREEEYGVEAMRKMRVVDGDCINELHTLVSKKIPVWPFGEPPETFASEPATSPVPCPSPPTPTPLELETAVVGSSSTTRKTSSSPPWPWSFRSTRLPNPEPDRPSQV